MYLIDTCVVSELARRSPDPGVVSWIQSVEEPLLHLSVLTVGEIVKGIAKLASVRRRKALLAWLESDLARRFEGRVLAITDEIARLWGEISAECERRGDRIPVIDGLIAATARAHGLTVVTRNVRDIAKGGGSVLDPWSRGRR